VTYLAGTPKPRVVTLSIKPAGKDRYSIAGRTHPALRYNIHIELGGVDGVIAPIVGKQPSDAMVWLDGGEVPGFLKMVGPLYEGGPLWTTELTSPTWNVEAR
jgi:hypothetical protein